MTQLTHEIPGITAELSSPQKRKIALRFELRGRRYFRALDAMAFAARYHRGLRKDGLTPEFDHQVTIALYVINLALPEEVLEDLICIILLHDVREDYSDPSKVPAGEPAVTYAMILALCGQTVADNVELLSKVTNGVKKEQAFYFAQIKTSWMALLVKLCDRMHNLSTMHGAFTRAKQIEYIAEAVNDILPLASYGSNTFSRYSAAFENVKFIMKLLIALLDKLNAEPVEATA
jgi:(p)ppGpp synthase/HD superfamily hydrolase